MENIDKFYLIKKELQDYYLILINQIHSFAVKINNLLNTTDFNTNEKMNDWSILINDVFNIFPFLKKFTVITEIILDKKNIASDNILYYKHVGHKILQSIYFIIRIVQKILLIILKNY